MLFLPTNFLSNTSGYPSSQEKDIVHKIFSIHLWCLRMQSIIPAIKFPPDWVAKVRGRLSL